MNYHKIKNVFSCLLFLFTPFLISAQPSTSIDSVFWRYAEISGIMGGFSSKLKVEVNYGENVTGWFRTPEMLVDSVTGKQVKYNSMIDALNSMSVQGWELVQSYFTDEAGGLKTLHFIIRREEARPK